MSIAARVQDIRSSEPFILVAMCFAIFTDTFIYGMIVPMLPCLLLQGGSISKEDTQKWISILLAVYGAALLLRSPVIGFVSDWIKSRKSLLLFGYGAIAASTSIFLFGRSPSVLVIARVCQGLSGAVIGVLGLAMIADIARPEKLGVFMAFGSLSSTWGMLVGPVIGGLMFDQYGVLGSFGLPIGMLILDVALRILIIERVQESWSADAQGAENAAASGGSDEASPLLDRQSPSAHSLNLSHFLNFRFMTAILVEITISSVFSAFETTLPLFTIETYQWAPKKAGLVFLGLTLPSFLSIPLARYTRNHDWVRRKIVAIELIVSAAPITGLGWAEDDTIQHPIMFIALVSLVGLFMTTSQAQTMAEVSASVHEIEAKHSDDSTKGSRMGTGFALCNMAIATSQFIGPVIAGSAKVGLGWSGMTVVLGSLCCFIGIFSLIFGF